MDALRAIATRRSTRKFKDLMPSDQMLRQVIEAGRAAPSGGNSQSTHFIVITDKGILDLLAVKVREAFSAMEAVPGMYRSLAHSIHASKNGNYIFHYSAPVLIITANRKDYGNHMADCSCALENMMIAANALDLGSCWINQLHWLDDHPDIASFMKGLGLREEETICGALALGYPDTEDGLPERKPLEKTGNPVTWIKG